MAIKRLTTRKWWDFVEVLENRETFKTGGALEGRPTNGRWDSGRLPMVYADEFAEADYAVFSYATPIAYHHPTLGWVFPDVRYSLTTSKHQGVIRTALGKVCGWDFVNGVAV